MEFYGGRETTENFNGSRSSWNSKQFVRKVVLKLDIWNSFIEMYRNQTTAICNVNNAITTGVSNVVRGDLMYPSREVAH